MHEIASSKSVLRDEDRKIAEKNTKKM